MGVLKRLYYCPACGEEIITDKHLYQGRETLINIGDGWNSPVIMHYRCHCGNKLAGSADVTDVNHFGIEKIKACIEEIQDEAIEL